jgi:hypothetical protein
MSIIHEINHLSLLNEMLDSLIERRMRRILRDVVISIFCAFELGNENMGHAVLSVSIFARQHDRSSPTQLTIMMVTYLHAFRRVVLASTEGEDVRLVRQGVDAVFF